MAINSPPEVHKLVVCANIFVRKGDKYLLLKRSLKKKHAPGVVHPIGGKIDVGEDPLVGAQRELKEEAGITVKNIKLEAVLTEIKPVKGKEENWLIFHFSGEYDNGEVGQTDEGELVWFDKQEIPVQHLFPSVQKVVKYILNDQTGTVFATFFYGRPETVESMADSIEVKALNVCK